MAGQLCGEKEAGSHILATGDHREGVLTRAPSICKEPERLVANPFPYIVPIFSRPLPSKVVKGEYFVLNNLLKSLPGGST